MTSLVLETLSCLHVFKDLYAHVKMVMETVETETQSTEASADTTVVIPVTCAIYHNGNSA